jgi:hypothetical protein
MAMAVVGIMALVVGLVALNAEKERTAEALRKLKEEQKKTVEAFRAEKAALERSQRAEASAGEQRQLALQTVRHVVDDIDMQLKERPGQTKLRKAPLDIFVSYWKIGGVHKGRMEYAQAAKQFEKGRDILLPLHKDGKLVGQFKNAVPEMDQEIRFCQAVEEGLSDPKGILRQPDHLRRPVLIAVMYALVRKEKQPSKAVVVADLLSDNVKEPCDLYEAACGYALCVPLTDQPSIRENYATRAVALLRQSIANGFKDIAHMKEDPDLDALRQREDFKKLIPERSERLVRCVPRQAPREQRGPGTRRSQRRAATISATCAATCVSEG